MKQCGICGHAAERGSICYDCRAALKRARDATVSQFQALPGLAMATATGSAPMHAVVRTLPARVSRPARAPRRPLPKPSAPAASPLLEVPGTRRGAPFVWVIVTLMVFVVTYVAYGVITTAIEATSNQQAPFVKPDAPAPAPVKPVPRLPGADAAVLAPHESAADTVPSSAQPAAAALPPAVAMPPSRASGRPKESARSVAIESGSIVPPTAPVMRDARPETAPKLAAVPSVASARAPEAPRSDRWQHMGAAIQSCAGKDFLGGMLCEQKVRLDYCDGFWGQVPQCPGATGNEHGQ